MAKFQFRIITGSSETICKQKYDDLLDPTKNPNAIVDPNDSTKYIHDPYTFYLFDQGGVGYLGDTPLFGGDSSKFNFISGNTDKDALKPEEIYFATADCTITDTSTEPDTTYDVKTGTIWLTNSTKVPSELSWTSFSTYIARYIASDLVEKATDVADSTYAGNESSLMTSAAIKKLIDENINAQSILDVAFFKDVDTVAITQAALDDTDTDYPNGKITVFTDKVAAIPTGAHAGDICLAFMCQAGGEYDESDGDGDICILVNLHDLIDKYEAKASLTTRITIEPKDGSPHTKEIQVEVNQSKKTGTEFEAMVLAAINAVSNNGTYDPTDSAGDNLSPNKFISESQLASILVELLNNFTQYGIVSAEGGTVDSEEEG